MSDETTGIYATLEQWTSGWRSRILEPGKKPYYYAPDPREWITTKGDLVRVINKAYPGVTYVSNELFNAKVREDTIPSNPLQDAVHSPESPNYGVFDEDL